MKQTCVYSLLVQCSLVFKTDLLINNQNIFSFLLIANLMLKLMGLIDFLSINIYFDHISAFIQLKRSN